jgi:hypothetical protein
MKKILANWFVIVLVTISSFSCSNSQNGSVNSQDDQFYYINRNPFDYQGIVESESGYYFFSGPTNQYLYYMDKKTMRPVILCNKPNCLHTEETDGTKLLECNALFSDNNSNLVFHNNNLYVVGTDIETMSKSIYKISIDGTRREKIKTFTEMIYNLIIHRDSIYYTTSDSGTVSGKEDSTTTKCNVYRVKMDQIHKEPELLYSVNGTYERILRLVGYNNGVYFQTMNFDNSEEHIANNITYRYDIIDNHITKFKEHLGLFLFNKDILVYNDENYRVYTDGLRETDPIPLNKAVGVPVNIDDKYIFVQNWDDNKGMCFSIYDRSGVLVKDFGYLGNGYDVYGGNDKYIFIFENGGRSNKFGNIQALYVIDKDKIASGTASLEKIFEFIPEVDAPGVIMPAS